MVADQYSYPDSKRIIPILYKELLKSDVGGRYRKTIFHIHTPASHDFTLINEDTQKKLKIKKLNSWRDLTTDDLIRIASFVKLSIFDDHEASDFECFVGEDFENVKELLSYLLLAHTLMKEKIELCIITDHNTICGFKKLQVAMNILINQRADYQIKTRLELGIEISCSDKNHIVGILEQKNSNQVRQLEYWIEENVMSPEDGTIRTSFDVFSMLKGIGAIGYIAHINTSNIFSKGYLSGTYKKKLFNSNLFDVIGVTNVEQIELIRDRLSYFSKKKYHFVIDNDAHNIEKLKSQFFFLKGDKLNFTAIQSAFKDFELSVSYQKEKLPEQYIKAIYVDGEEFLKGREKKYLIVNFSSNMNAFIGGRGSGKSTLLNILGFLTSQQAETKSDLFKILRQGTSCLVYHYFGIDYYVILHTSRYNSDNEELFVKDYFKESIDFMDDDSERFQRARKIAIEKRVQIFTYDGSNVRIIAKQKDIFKKIFTRKFAVNDLVNISENEDELTNFIDKTLFKNKNMRNRQNFYSYGKGFEGLFKKYEQRQIILDRRKENVSCLIKKYNETQNKKLRVVFSQKDIENKFFNWYTAFDRSRYTKDSYFKNYALTYNSLFDYLEDISEKNGNCLETVKLFYERKYDEIVNNANPKKFFLNKNNSIIEKELKYLENDEDVFEFVNVIQKEIITKNCEKYCKDFLKNYFRNSETFSLEFNINNKENVRNEPIDYHNVVDLSMGQKVVAMLSFILSYNDYIKDFSPFIVDQPEDNLDNQYIYRNLVNDFRTMKNSRQIILATHNSTIIMNSGCEQVVVMNSNNKNGWCETTGYVSNPKIVNHVINILEGGKEAFSNKLFLYRDRLSKFVSSDMVSNMEKNEENDVFNEIVDNLESFCYSKELAKLSKVLEYIKKID